MKRRILLVCGLLAISLGIGTVTMAGNEGAKAPDGTIVIDGKKPVKFDHQKHLGLGIDCATCHHDGEHKGLDAAALAGKSAEELQCRSCHNKSFAKKKLQKPKAVYHTRCRSCHKAGVEGKKGPTKCAGCHGKKAKKAKQIEGC